MNFLQDAAAMIYNQQSGHMQRNIWLRQLFALVVKNFSRSCAILRVLSCGRGFAVHIPHFGYGITLDAGVLRLGVLNQSGGAIR